MERDMQTYKNALGVAIARNYYLNEEYHIVNTFYDCINDIIFSISEYKQDVFNYSGWFFDYKNKQCNKSKLLNNETYPIYVKIIDDFEYANIMSSQDRSKIPDKIYITINLAKLRDSLYNKAVLAHEFRHTLEMYIDKSKSHIYDSIYKIASDPIQNRINPYVFELSVNTINLFAKSEERARIDGTVYFLKQLNPDLSFIKENYNKVAKLIDLSKDHHQLYNMGDLLEEELSSKKASIPIVLIGYLWNKYIIDDKININITEQDVLKHDNKSIADEVYSFLMANYRKFYNDLTNIVGTHLIFNK